MLPERLAAYGIAGPAVGELLRAGHLDVDGRRVTRDEVSVTRPGQRFAFVMDTGLCDGVYALAEQRRPAGHRVDVPGRRRPRSPPRSATSPRRQAARVAAESGVRTLVLTHFSQRYADPRPLRRRGPREHFAGDLVIAEDLMTVPVPPRRVASAG